MTHQIADKLLAMWVRAVVVVVCAAAVLAGDQYSVPDPNIEAFSPKGLRLSIPDSPNIKSVQFFLSFTNPIVDNDPGSVAKEVDDKQGSYWIYYNPSVVIKPGDMVHYKITVHGENGRSWWSSGSRPINRVLSLADSSVVATADDCDDQGQQHLTVFPNFDELEEPGLTSGAKTGQVKSAYSMYKTMETKPITRSSTTTTSGSFYVKPTGEVESSGFKTASSFDSTRRDGEQWQHSKSELTAAEIEELKRLHGQDFFTMPAFANLHSGGVGGGSSSSSYRSSYSSSSQARPTYASSSSYLHDGQTAQTGQTADLLPLVRPASGYSSFSKYEEHKVSGAEPVILSPSSASYSSDDTTFIRNPVRTPASSSYSSSSDTSYVRSPVIKPVLTSDTSSFSTGISDDRSPGHLPGRPFNSEREELEDTQVPIAPSYSSVQSKYHRKETVKTTGPVVNTYPSGGASSKVTETYEYKAPPKTIVTLPLANTQREPTLQTPNFPQRYYNGDIFRSSVRPTTPQSCAATNYSHKSPSQIDVVALERSVQEVQCLAVLAETTMKAEIYALKEANTNLVNRFQDLEQQFRRFRSECKCGY